MDADNDPGVSVMTTAGNHNKQNSSAATASQIRQILGPAIDEELVLRILDTNAGQHEVQAAVEWLEDDDYMGAEKEEPVYPRIRLVYEILRAERESDRRDES